MQTAQGLSVVTETTEGHRERRATCLSEPMEHCTLPGVERFAVRDWFLGRCPDNPIRISSICDDTFLTSFCEEDGLVEANVPEMKLVAHDFYCTSRAEHCLGDFSTMPHMYMGHVAMLLEGQGAGTQGPLCAMGRDNWLLVRDQRTVSRPISLRWTLGMWRVTAGSIDRTNFRRGDRIFAPAFVVPRVH